MKLYIARHGRTNYNELRLSNADPTVDVHLTPTGITQAKALAEKLKSIPLEHIFVSELKRTQQTAAFVKEFHTTVEITVDPRLNDIRSGFEGQPFAEYLARLDTAADRWTARFNGGESIEDVKTRVADFLHDLGRGAYLTVLIVTSEWIILALLAIIKQLPNERAWELAVSQGSYLELEI